MPSLSGITPDLAKLGYVVFVEVTPSQVQTIGQPDYRWWPDSTKMICSRPIIMLPRSFCAHTLTGGVQLTWKLVDAR